MTNNQIPITKQLKAGFRLLSRQRWIAPERALKLLFVLLYYLQFHRIMRYLLRKKVIILTYHGFTDKDCSGGNSRPLYLDVERFKRQMEYLNKYYNVISLGRLIEHYTSGVKLPPNPVIITIDDGYKSNYTLAYPILKQFNIPATIFLTTDFIDKKEMLWLDRQEAYHPLEWSEVLEMVKSGIISIGSHTSSHAILTRCSPQNMEKELLQSKQLIEEKTGLTCRLFSYPNGEAGDFDDRTKKLLGRFGYTCGLTTVSGMNDRHSDVFELKRLHISSNVDLILFTMILSGVFKFFVDVKRSISYR